MGHRTADQVEQFIRQALIEVGTLMQRSFAEVEGRPPQGSALDQCGLIDVVHIVEEYLEHNELGLALEHLE